MPRFSDIHDSFRDGVRKMVDKCVAPIAAEIDQQDRPPIELFPILGDMGILQLLVPEKYGGPDGDLTAVCIAREEIGRVSASCAMLAGQNSMGLVLPLLHFGTEEQRQKYLPQLAKGRTITASAITEAGAGSDVASMTTRAVRDGDEWVLTGRKIYVTQGSLANYMTVYAKTGDVNRRGHDNISVFIVPAKAEGMYIGPDEKKMGLNGVPNNEITFDGVRIPDEDRIGAEGQGFINAMHTLHMNRPVIAAMAVGMAQGALDLCIRYAKERQQFGRPIGDFQGVQFMLADMAMQIAAARELVYEVARKIDAGEHDQLAELSSMAKCLASDMVMRVTTDAVQIFGGLGYMRSCPVERMMRDAKITQIFEGTNQIQRLVIARSLLKN